MSLTVRLATVFRRRMLRVMVWQVVEAWMRWWTMSAVVPRQLDRLQFHMRRRSAGNLLPHSKSHLLNRIYSYFHVPHRTPPLHACVRMRQTHASLSQPHLHPCSAIHFMLARVRVLTTLHPAHLSLSPISLPTSSTLITYPQSTSISISSSSSLSSLSISSSSILTAPIIAPSQTTTSTIITTIPPSTGSSCINSTILHSQSTSLPTQPASSSSSSTAFFFFFDGW